MSKTFLVVTLLVGSLASSCRKSREEVPSATMPKAEDRPTPRLARVRFANLPYADHTYSSIGVEKGFFNEAGIDLVVDTIKIDDVVPSLLNGTYDVVSVPPGILFASHERAPDTRSFVFGDLFQGYALMARPALRLKTYADFRNAGLSHETAVAATVAQIKGRKFAYPTEPAIKPFIDLLLARGHLSRQAFKAIVLDDPLTVAAMRNNEADLQVGGVPSRIILQREGCVPLISSVDLASGANPSPSSKELAAILQNGWATTRAFYDSHHDVVVRLASVSFRIMQFMHTNRDEAMSIHMRYLTKVTGTTFTTADAAVIYDSLDPFYTFEQQKDWFHQPKSPFYYLNVNGAILQSFIDDGIYKTRAPSVEDVIFSDDIYRELESLKAQVEAGLAGVEKSSSAGAQQDALQRARAQSEHFDYLDALQSLNTAGAVGAVKN